MDQLSIIDKDGEWVIVGTVQGNAFSMRSGFEATLENVPYVHALVAEVQARRESNQGFSMNTLLQAYKVKTPPADANSIGYCTRFAESVGLGKPVSILSTALLHDYLSRLHWTHHSDSAKRDCAAIMAMISYGRKIGLPIAAVEPPEFKRFSRRDRVLHVSDWHHLLEASKKFPGLTMGIHMMLLAGARPGEAFSLQKRDVDGINEKVTFTTRKGAASVERRKVPMSHALKSWWTTWSARERKRRHGGILWGTGEYLCVDDDLQQLKRHGADWTSSYYIGDSWKLIKDGARRLQIDAGGSGDAYDNLRLSDLRRSFATALAEVDVPVHEIAVLLGHTGVAQTGVYLGTSVSDRTSEKIWNLL